MAPTLELLPPEVELCRDDRAQVQVVIRNPGKEAIPALELSATNNTRLTVTPALPFAIDGLGTGAGHVVVLDVTSSGSFSPGKVFFRVESGRGPSRQVATAPLEVKRHVLDSADKVARLELRIPAGAVSDAESSEGQLSVSNTSTNPVRIELQKLESPSLDFTPEKPWANAFDLGPGSTRSQRFSVKANEVVKEKGKRTLEVSATVGWNDGVCGGTGRITATQDVDVGILAESEVLTAFGVPTLFLLPGVLVLSTSSLLWRLGLRFGREEKEFPFPAKEAEFWILAVLVSGITLFVAWWFTGRPYLHVYSLSDVAKLWAYPVGIAAFLYLVAERARGWRLNVVLKRREREEAARRKRTLVETDDALGTLEKLSNVGAPLFLPSYELDGNVYFEFPPSDMERWFFPPIVIRLKEGADTTRAKMAALRDSADATVEKLLAIVDRGDVEAWLWSRQGDGPREGAGTKPQLLYQSAPIIEEEEEP